MVRIARQTERSPHLYFPAARRAVSGDRPENSIKVVPERPQSQRAVADAVSHAACQTAHELGAAAIVTPTSSGYTARTVAKYRPAMPIVATTPNPRVQRQLMLHWGVCPLLAKRAQDTDQTIATAIRTAHSLGIVNAGDTVVLTAGSAGSAPGTTNVMKVQVVGEP